LILKLSDLFHEVRANRSTVREKPRNMHLNSRKLTIPNHYFLLWNYMPS